MDRQHRIPALLSRSDPPAVTLVVCADPDAEVLAKWDAMVAGIPQADVTQLSAWARLRATGGLHTVVFAGVARL